MTQNNGKGESGPKRAKPSSGKTANASAEIKARASVKVAKKGDAPKKTLQPKKSVPSVKTKNTVSAKVAKGGPKAYARGDVVPANLNRNDMTKGLAKKPVALSPGLLQTKKAPLPTQLKPKAKATEKLVPFDGWAPLNSVADIVRLQNSRNFFSEDYSVDD
jgi:hypothetical protein